MNDVQILAAILAAISISWDISSGFRTISHIEKIRQRGYFDGEMAGLASFAAIALAVWQAV